MKKFSLLLVAAMIAVSLCACGKKEQTPAVTTPAATSPTAAAPTEEMTLPTIDPTMGTNIPDPEVDPNSTDDMLDPSEDTRQEENATENGTRSRGSNNRGITGNQGMQFGE